jgi:hypothetical protein
MILDCLKIRNVNADESVSSNHLLFLAVEGSYEILKGKDAGKLVKETDGEKRLFGSMVSDDIEEIKFVTRGKIAWTTPK